MFFYTLALKKLEIQFERITQNYEDEWCAVDAFDVTNFDNVKVSSIFPRATSLNQIQDTEPFYFDVMVKSLSECYGDISGCVCRIWDYLDFRGFMVFDNNKMPICVGILEQ